MHELNPNEVKRLLKLIKHPADKKAVKQYLQELIEVKSNSIKNPADKFRKRKNAKKALAIISRIGIELLKHKAIDGFFDLFD